jgi:hypothetical protein
MSEEEVDNQVTEYLRAVKNMNKSGILTPNDVKKLTTKIKAWAYDEMRKLK